MKIYTAGPISGLTYDEVSEYFNGTKSILESFGYTVLNPMSGKGELRTELKFKAHGYDGVPVATNNAIFGRDRWMVSQSDVIYANLMNCGDRISIGTCMELAWGFILGKHIVIAMQKDNIHQHAFVISSAHIIYETHEEAMNYLCKLQDSIAD